MRLEILFLTFFEQQYMKFEELFFHTVMEGTVSKNFDLSLHMDVSDLHVRFAQGVH